MLVRAVACCWPKGAFGNSGGTRHWPYTLSPGKNTLRDEAKATLGPAPGPDAHEPRPRASCELPAWALEFRYGLIDVRVSMVATASNCICKRRSTRQPSPKPPRCPPGDLSGQDSVGFRLWPWASSPRGRSLCSCVRVASVPTPGDRHEHPQIMGSSGLCSTVWVHATP